MNVEQLVSRFDKNDPIHNVFYFPLIDLNEHSSNLLYESLFNNSYLTTIIIKNIFDQKKDKKLIEAKNIKIFFNLLIYKPKLNYIEVIDVDLNDSFLISISELLCKLPKNREKVALHFRDCKISTQGAVALSNAIRNNAPIHWLDLRDNKSIGDVGCKELFFALKSNSFLNILDVIKCGVGFRALEALKEVLPQNNTLHSLLIQNTLDLNCVHLLYDILSLQTCLLESLFLWRCDLSKEHIVTLYKALKVNNKLQQLGLSYNELDNDSVYYLSKIIKNNKSIVRLQIGKNRFADVAGCYIGLALTHNNTLQHLDVSRNLLRSIGVLPISMALKTNLSLQVLDLRYNSFDHDCTDSIASIIGENKTLYSIRLSGNIFSNESIYVFAEKLRYNAVLTSIELCEVGMTSSGFERICQCLYYNKTLKVLDVSKNEFRISSAFSAFSELLKNNSVIQSIGLDECFITDDFCEYISEGLAHNNTLKTLLLRRNCMTPHGLELILGSVSGNSSLTSLELGEQIGISRNEEYMISTSQIIIRNKYLQSKTIMKDLKTLSSDAFF